MPIGSAKIGVLGAGLVPGGTTTFNAPGTFTVPPGVKKVNITGKGGTGNPGNSGNPGNAGNPGNGAPGGYGGLSITPAPIGGSIVGGEGAGLAFKSGTTVYGQFANNAIGPTMVYQSRCPSVPSAQLIGQSGQAGNAGSAGNAGTAGNPGQASSGLCKTFPGGAGGNAGLAGNAGAAGTGGTSGTPAQDYGSGAGGGAGGNGGGSGGQGFGNPGSATNRGTLNGWNVNNYPAPAPTINNCPANLTVFGGWGGGGAGATNSGCSGSNASSSWNYLVPAPGQNTAAIAMLRVGKGGADNNISASAGNWPSPPVGLAPFAPYATANTMGGPGGAGTSAPCHVRKGMCALVLIGQCAQPLINAQTPFTTPPLRGVPGRVQTPGTCLINFSPALPQSSNVYRAGGGGSAGASINFTASNSRNTPSWNTCTCGRVGGGGGGGGRGNAGGAGGTQVAGGAGSAGTPQTFNCVPVTPGSPYPITIGGPSGGQIVISWNPQ